MIRAWAAAGAIIVSAGGLGCHRHPHDTSLGAVTQQDSLRGIVSVTGTSYGQHIVLRLDESARSLVMDSADSASLTHLGGAEVVVHGREEDDDFRVTSFTVRAIEHAPVVDGVLVREGARIALRSSEGEIPLGNPPAAFETLIGARVWVGGPLDTGPNSYGIIATTARTPST